jgi:hypothetical protein
LPPLLFPGFGKITLSRRVFARSKVRSSASAAEPPTLLQRLQAAGDDGMSALQLMQAVQLLDTIAPAAALAPLREAGSLVQREGRYYARLQSGLHPGDPPQRHSVPRGQGRADPPRLGTSGSTAARTES